MTGSEGGAGKSAELPARELGCWQGMGKCRRGEGTGQEEMKFTETIIRDWLFIHLCIYLVYRYLLAHCVPEQGTVESKPCPEKSSKKDKQANGRLYPMI